MVDTADRSVATNVVQASIAWVAGLAGMIRVPVAAVMRNYLSGRRIVLGCRSYHTGERFL
jgi:hypothetical protein